MTLPGTPEKKEVKTIKVTENLKARVLEEK
jgi:hypothetical protein